ncbi:hypothetical protein RS9916_30324 [Synechococcus sp. RS9916]|nr:hypothetical protein RS9916_30324 [Synechococcus sp. RS9916]
MQAFQQMAHPSAEGLHHRQEKSPLLAGQKFDVLWWGVVISPRLLPRHSHLGFYGFRQ